MPEIKIPIGQISDRFVFSEAYVKTYMDIKRDYEIHYRFDSTHSFIVDEKTARKISKANKKIREKMLEELKSNEYPLTSYDCWYQSYPTEAYCDYTIIMPKEVLEKMKKEKLVLLVVTETNDYEGYDISVEIWTPERIEKEWKKEEITLDKEKIKRLIQ